MFYINRETPLDTALLQKMIQRFRLTVEPKLTKYKNYYDGQQGILEKTYSDPSKPCNKTVINYCKNIVDSYCGYLAAPGHISYRSEQDIEDIMDVLRYNDYQAEDADFLLDALIHGKACELMYIDNESKTRFRLIDPTQCFGVYDDSLTADLLYFVRMYKVNEWDDNDEYEVSVYSDTTKTTYKMVGMNGTLTFIDEEPHYFAQCPANIFYLPDEKSIFDCIMSAQDTYNELLSAEVDDYAAFCDAYLTLEGMDAETEDIKSMKENRVLILPVGAKASWLTKSSNDTQIENILKRLHDSIYRTAACPDFSSESFVGGVSSGIAIQYRLTGCETRAAKIEGAMKMALQRRIEIISGVASLKLGEEVFRDIQIEFQRNIPEDITSTINVINSLRGIVSDATLLGQIPFITDVNAEIEAINKQKEEAIALYGFGDDTDTDYEEDEAE